MSTANRDGNTAAPSTDPDTTIWVWIVQIPIGTGETECIALEPKVHAGQRRGPDPLPTAGPPGDAECINQNVAFASELHFSATSSRSKRYTSFWWR